VSGPRSFLDGRVTLHAGDCLDVVRALPDNSVDSVVTDPPYALVSIGKRFGKAGAKAPASDGATGVYARAASGFMGKAWDTGERAFAVEFWAEIWRVLKPGGHVAAFSGTRTYHRLACAIEDAGFEIRDQLAWAYGSGFPKSHDVSKGIDRHNGDAREKVRVSADAPAYQRSAGNHRPWMDNPDHMIDGPSAASAASAAWDGWGTALKPAWEPICLARKPLMVPASSSPKGDRRMVPATVAANVLAHGTGAINVDGCRVGDEGGTASLVGDPTPSVNAYGNGVGVGVGGKVVPIEAGRWPANILHDGSDEVLALFPTTGPAKAAHRGEDKGATGCYGVYGGESTVRGHDDAGGSAARFFYTAKADADDRIGSKHPTVKPRDLMQWLVRLITPPGGTTLDPFAGSGTTGEAAWREGFSAILIERDAEYQADIARRMEMALEGPVTRAVEIAKARPKPVRNDVPSLFDGDLAETGGGDVSTVNLLTRSGGQLRRPDHGVEQALATPRRRIGPIGLKR
jgi:DNA modification methylase